MTEPNPFDLYVDSRIRMILAVHAQNGADFVPHTMITMQEGELATLRGELAALRRQVAEHHCVPTQDAYDAAVAALNKHRDRADVLADLVDVVALQLGRTGDMKPQQLHYMVGSIVERLQRAYGRDAAKRAAHPDTAAKAPLQAKGVICPVCAAQPGEWCHSIGNQPVGWIHDERRDAVDRPAETGPALTCGTCYGSGERGWSDCTSCSIRAQRCTSCDHLTSAHSDGVCWYAVTEGTIGANLVCPCGGEGNRAPDPFRAVEMRAENGVFTRVEVHGEHVAATGNGMALLSPWAAEVVGNAYLHAAREALANATSLDSLHRYRGARAAGLSDPEAREEGWPTIPRGGQPLPPIPAPPAVDGACPRCGGLEGNHIFRDCPEAPGAAAESVRRVLDSTTATLNPEGLS